jgi:iron complex outermembrane receptor protein
VPNVTLNAGFYYGIEHKERVWVEPRFWFQYIGPQYLWDNCNLAAGAAPLGGNCGVNTGSAKPSTVSMPSYTTTNLSFTVPVHKYVNLSLYIMNLFNTQYNEFEYISSGGYFSSLYPNSNYTANYINAYPGAPRTVYGTITFQF